MKKLRRIPALLCALALVGALAVPALGSSSSTPVYLLAANDKFCDLPGGALPVAVDGVIYIPYSVFDRNLTGVDLGVYYGITPERGTILTLYALSGMLTFTMIMGRCEDNLGNVMDFHAVPRGNPSIPYVPAAAVCEFFGLQYSFLPTSDRGTCIRITNPSSPHLDDGNFLSSARGAMTTRYNQVLQSLTPQPSVPVATPARPSVSRPPAGSNGDVHVYLSIDASQSASDLTGLFPAGVYALFLFTPESLAARASQVRKAVAAGHSVGLLLDSSLDTEAALEQLEEGNRLLTHIARVKTRIAAGTGGLSASLREGLAAQGWALWEPSLQAAASPSTIQTVLGSRPATFRMDLTATPTTSVVRVLSLLQAEGYDLRQPLETDL